MNKVQTMKSISEVKTINNIESGIGRNECVGCKACSEACSKDVISYEIDEEGFEYPVVDAKKCTECGSCLKVCPIYNKLPSREDNPVCFSAWSREDAVREASTSGGFFYELSKVILEEKGIVFGARYSSDYKTVFHSFATNIDELSSLVGSKYVQSDLSGIHSQILDFLRDGKQVLFAGTPCQCASIRTFLDGKIPLDNLFLMDFVCYSIYSPLVYRKWLEELEEQDGSRITRIRFKSKKFGWRERCVEIEYDNGKIVYQSDVKGEDLFIAGIEAGNLYQRHSCFNCNFREKSHRAVDFTVGDFWGIKNQTEYDLYKGISFVITNTPKAREIIKKINKNMVIRRCELDDIVPGNPNIIQNPILQSEKRVLFFEKLKESKFSDALYSVTQHNISKTKEDGKKLKEILFDRRISISMYIYYNYFCKNVIRKGTSKIIPYKNSKLSFGLNSRLILEGNRNLNIGTNKVKNSRAETYIRLEKDSRMILNHGADLYYGTTIELMENATFEAGYFSMNTGTVIVVDYMMKFGEYVGFGRNNMVYDSDFHALHTSSGSIVNRPRETVIGNHVWITSNNTILPGSNIGDNTIVGSRNVINFHVPKNSFVRNNVVSPFSGWWSELPNLKEETLLAGKRMILVGFGMEGKAFYAKHKSEVSAIIDNNSKSELTTTFDKYKEMNKKSNEDEAFVICSTRYYDELYKMIREQYPDALVLSAYKFK